MLITVIHSLRQLFIHLFIQSVTHSLIQSDDIHSSTIHLKNVVLHINKIAAAV